MKGTATCSDRPSPGRHDAGAGRSLNPRSIIRDVRGAAQAAGVLAEVPRLAARENRLESAAWSRPGSSGGSGLVAGRRESQTELAKHSRAGGGRLVRLQATRDRRASAYNGTRKSAADPDRGRKHGLADVQETLLEDFLSDAAADGDLHRGAVVMLIDEIEKERQSSGELLELCRTSSSIRAGVVEARPPDGAAQRHTVSDRGAEAPCCTWIDTRSEREWRSFGSTCPSSERSCAPDRDRHMVRNWT